jgi:hypothetical protein
MKNRVLWALLLLLLVAGCTAGEDILPTATLKPTSTSPAPTQTSQPLPTQTNTPEPLPTAIPTAVPVSEADYQGTWTYTHQETGFTLQVPMDWVIDETSSGDTLMDSLALKIHPKDDSSHLLLRMTFRNDGEETYLWPTGVGAGEFLDGGTLEIAGELATRKYFVCPNGEVNSVWYMGMDTPHLQRGNLELGFLYSYSGVYCEEGYSLVGKDLYIGELIIASLQVP